MNKIMLVLCCLLVPITSGASDAGVLPAPVSNEVIVSQAPVIVSEVPSEPSITEIIEAGTKAVKTTAVAIKSRDLPYWLLAISGIIWFLVLVARRWLGAFVSGKSARVAALLAGVVAAVATEMLAGVQTWKAVMLVLTGGGAIALNEALRLIGVDVSIPKVDAQAKKVAKHHSDV